MHNLIRRPNPLEISEDMAKKLEEDTEPYVQRLFFESYRETDMRPQGLRWRGVLCFSR